VPDAPLFRGVQTFVLCGKLDTTCIEYLEHHAIQLRRLQRFEIDDAAAAKRLKKVLGDCLVVGG
jgi:hypothetical protein